MNEKDNKFLKIQNCRVSTNRLFPRSPFTVETNDLSAIMPAKRESPYRLEFSTSSTESDSSDSIFTPFFFSDKKQPMTMSHLSSCPKATNSIKSASEQHSALSSPYQNPSFNPQLAVLESFIASSHCPLPRSPTQQDIQFLNCCRFVEFAIKTRSVSNLRSAFTQFVQGADYCSGSVARPAASKRIYKINDYFGIPEIMQIYSNPCCFRCKPNTEKRTIYRQVVYAICKNVYAEFDFRTLKSFVLDGNSINEYQKRTLAEM